MEDCGRLHKSKQEQNKIHDLEFQSSSRCSFWVFRQKSLICFQNEAQAVSFPWRWFHCYEVKLTRPSWAAFHSARPLTLEARTTESRFRRGLVFTCFLLKYSPLPVPRSFLPMKQGPQSTFGLTLDSDRSTITYEHLLLGPAGSVGWRWRGGGWVGGCLLHCCTARKMQSAKVLATEVRELFNSDSMSLLFFFFFGLLHLFSLFLSFLKSW